MTSEIACVVPCCSGEAYLAAALESVRQQHRAVAELIVVDDGSTDASVEIAQRYGARILSTSGRQGPSVARNMGWQSASSDYIAFLDADDLWSPDHTESLARLLDQHAAVELAYGTVVHIGAMNGFRNNPLAPATPTDSRIAAAATCFVPQMGVMIRRKALESVGGYDGSLRTAEDFDLFARLSLRAPFVTSGLASASYRQHDAQTTRVMHRVVARQSMMVRRRNWERLADSLSVADTAALRAAMRRECSDSLHYVFAGHDRDAFRELLTLVDTIPGGAEAARAWRIRSALLWWPWTLGSKIWRALPFRPQRLQRWVERSLLRSSP